MDCLERALPFNDNDDLIQRNYTGFDSEVFRQTSMAPGNQEHLSLVHAKR